MLVQLDTYLCGTRIRIARGQLAGLTGEVAKMADDDGNYVLTIDGWAKGVCLVMSGDFLTLEPDAVVLEASNT